MQRVNTPTAYLLWGLSIFGIFGIHRLYTGRILSGIVYLFTFGIFGLGQLLDLLLIPGLVAERNRELARLQGDVSAVMLPILMPSDVPSAPSHPETSLRPMQRLLQAAHEHGGTLSPAQVALYTEMEPDELQALLYEAERLGYMETTNDPKTGAVRYRFDL